MSTSKITDLNKPVQAPSVTAPAVLVVTAPAVTAIPIVPAVLAVTVPPITEISASAAASAAGVIKLDDVVKPVVEPVSNKGLMLRTVHGPMHDLLTGLNYDVFPTECLKDSLWLASQVANGKMVICA